MTSVRTLNKGFFRLVVISILFCGSGWLHAAEQTEITVGNILNWVNQIRTEKGLQQLDIDTRLNETAKAHSEKMSDHDLLAESAPGLGTPLERIRTAGLTDTNNLVVVGRTLDWESLLEQLESGNNTAKILSHEMTHLGVGIFSDPDGSRWVTLHMIERAISFTLFTMHQSNGNPVKRSMTINGNTTHEKVRALLVPPEESKAASIEHIVVPDGNGDFEIELSFGISTGNFGFEFSISDNGMYELKNFFSMDIR